MKTTLNLQERERPAVQSREIFLSLRRLTKIYGETRANSNISFDIHCGEVIGLVGANGAGKSTLVQSISGLVRPDEGELVFGPEASRPEHFTRSDAQVRGIRTVFQEHSLSPNLSAVENFLIEYSSGTDRRWRAQMRAMATESLQSIFPHTRIDLNCPVEQLPLAERQMIEIARAACDPRLRLLILDEPTSSLDARQSESLRAFVRRRARDGVSFIFISHKLKEVIHLTDRFVVLKNGTLVSQGDTRDSSIEHLLREMGTTATTGVHRSIRKCVQESAGTCGLRMAETDASNGLGHPLEILKGEVVGLAGLEGNGQSQMLREILRQARVQGPLIAERGLTASFVTGDRVEEGILPGLSVLKNTLVSLVAKTPWLTPISPRAEREAAARFLNDLGVPDDRFDAKITEMSGGNQQKALMVRPLLIGADILLLDDPTRGVDVQTKRQIYELIHRSADDGRIVVWYSSEDTEFHQCDRVLVLHDQRIVKELRHDEIGEQAILDASFSHVADHGTDERVDDRREWSTVAIGALPFLVLALVYGAIVLLNPAAASGFGLSLLLTAAINLVFVALGQMFIVSGAQIDLGAGPFAALVSVIAATLMPAFPLAGIAAILALVCLYIGLGAAIVVNALPSLVVTLGASFVWLGVGHTLLPTPGGTSPEWLVKMFDFDLPFLSTPLVLILLPAILAWGVSRSRLGVALLGFGRNPGALVKSGWSAIGNQAVRYGIAAAFITVGGLSMTALNNAADVNSGSSLTLLSVATVVIGGCPLHGGVMRPFSVAAGAITLSLVGTLLGSLGVSTSYTAAIQGGLLLGLLLVQVLERKVAR
ncbi:ATP-binding cassette domain-containing protein [Variovorax sp. efr-133-TYG-130]|uniref:ATP-binding cassette domain-containing protein n=1 Tax=Variovorax sp. efr-133-TYG-130 TaxID=3040327 RepID=UPI002554CA2D|nr:ATP-binding cassette domain-containing protein [Variovorax sp. efr-133-TYG-130]